MWWENLCICRHRNWKKGCVGSRWDGQRSSGRQWPFCWCVCRVCWVGGVGMIMHQMLLQQKNICDYIFICTILKCSLPVSWYLLFLTKRPQSFLIEFQAFIKSDFHILRACLHGAGGWRWGTPGRWGNPPAEFFFGITFWRSLDTRLNQGNQAFWWFVTILFNSIVIRLDGDREGNIFVTCTRKNKWEVIY